MRLVLWDVDGTLVRAGAVAREVFDRAVEAALGRHPGDHGVQMSGKTDPQIAVEIMRAAQVADGELESHLPVVLDGLERELAAAAHLVAAHGHVLPGVEDVLARLDAEPGVAQTVLTGNLAANAAVKLGAFGLDKWFDLSLGAYGSDHRDRRELVPLALGKARGRGWDVAPERTWVVGDTPRDLECARAGGARCLLVATGRFAYDELAGLGPDEVAADLSDTDRVVGLLTSSPGGPSRA